MAGTKSMEQRLDEWWEKHYGDTYGQEIAEDAPQEVEEEPPRFVSFGEGPETLVQLTPNLDDPDFVGWAQRLPTFDQEIFFAHEPW